MRGRKTAVSSKSRAPLASMSQPGSAATGRASRSSGAKASTAGVDRCRGGGVERGGEQRGIRGQCRSVEGQHQDLGRDAPERRDELREQAVADDDGAHPVGDGDAPVPEGGPPLMRPPEFEEFGVGARDDHAGFVEQRRRVAAPVATVSRYRPPPPPRGSRSMPPSFRETPARRGHCTRRGGSPGASRPRRSPQSGVRTPAPRPWTMGPAGMTAAVHPAASNSLRAPSRRTPQAREAPRRDGAPTSAHKAERRVRNGASGAAGAIRRPAPLRRHHRAQAVPRARVNAIRSRARSRGRSGSRARGARPSTGSSDTRRGSCR